MSLSVNFQDRMLGLSNDDIGQPVLTNSAPGEEIVTRPVPQMPVALGTVMPLATISGGNADDNVVGTNGNDELYGLGGNDKLEGKGGADLLDGGSGEDTATYENSANGLEVYLLAGGPSTGEAAGDRFVSIENLIGSAFNDSLYGDNFDNKLYGGDGNDTLYGYGGVNWLYGGNGVDNVIGGPGTDHMFGEAGIDTLSYQLSTAGVTISLLDPSINKGDAAGDTYSGFEDVTGSTFNDVIYGDGGTVNNLWGLAGDDKIYGGGGYDVMIGDKGADYLDGGAGNDLADYETAEAGLTASLATPSINTGDAAGDVYVSIEDLAGSFYDDVLYGDAQNNSILGLGGNDRIYGGAGDDGLGGSEGADFLDGGDGIDTAGYSSAGGPYGFYGIAAPQGVGVTASLLDPSINTGEAAGDTYANIENLLGSEFADKLHGDNSSNTILGGGGNDQLFGEGGDDVLDGGLGGDALNGGAGFDNASYAGATAGVGVSLGGTFANAGDAAGDTYASVEGILGSAFADTLGGDGNANRLLGNAGDDRLLGEGGDDFLYGGAGADSMDGGAGFDTVNYASAAGAVTVSLQNPSLNTGEALGDTYGNIEAIEGSSFGDSITGYANFANNLYGGAGDDRLFGGGADDVLVGGSGADAFDGGGGIDFVNYVTSSSGVTADMMPGNATAGDAAGDTFISIENFAGSNFNDTLSGDNASNTILGLAGNDTLQGRGGDDGLNGGAGADFLSGGSGLDTAIYADASAGVVAFLLSPQSNTGDAAGDTYDSIENIIGTQFGDLLGGNDVQNTIQGGLGNDYLYGAGGDDLLDGGVGADVLEGQAGYDYAVYASAAAGVTVFLGGAVFNTGEAAGDTYNSIEGVFGSNQADLIAGDEGDNTIFGVGGNDLLFGGGGQDYLLGGDGDDQLQGGRGADLMDGGNGVDLVSYSEAAAGVVAFMLAPQGNAGEALNDNYANIEGLVGSQFGDILGGTEGANLITGGGGNDYIFAAGGDDILEGGAGADQMEGQAGFDFISYRTATSGVAVFIGGAQLNSGDAQGDTYTGIEGVLGSYFGDILGGDSAGNVLQGFAGDDWIFGSDGDDYVVGDEGNDILQGGVGADSVDGGAGIDTASYRDAATGVTADLSTPSLNTGEAAGDRYNLIENLEGSKFADKLSGDAGANTIWGLGGTDTLKGGGGADSFAFTAVSDGGDTVLDFAAGQDRFTFSSGAFGLPTGALDPAHFFAGAGAVAIGAGAAFLFDTATHQLFYDADGAGGQAAALMATLTNGANVGPGDIWIV
ncbi:hypothetical protein sos41_14920 [Alphaproteobacteria bacterium SO-S41]|nr:hypothetical protein sos41_14920 [Alphaproteobacteria bacterium SO-S41]